MHQAFLHQKPASLQKSIHLSDFYTIQLFEQKKLPFFEIGTLEAHQNKNQINPLISCKETLLISNIYNIPNS